MQTTNNLEIVMSKIPLMMSLMCYKRYGQVRLSGTVTCNQYYLLPCGADGAR